MNKIDPILLSFIDEHQLNDNKSSVSHLAESIENGNTTTSERLFEIIEASRHDLSLQRAASNAFDILNKAHISLSNRDFSGVHLSDVNLSGAIAECANFDRSILRNVSLIHAKLYGTTFDEARLENVKFSDELYEPMSCQTLNAHTDQVHVLCELSDGLFASGSRDGEIKIWDSTKNFTCIQTLTPSGKVDIREGHRPINLLWLKKSQQLISKSSDKIGIWSLGDNKYREKILSTKSNSSDYKQFNGLYELSDGKVATIAHCDSDTIYGVWQDRGYLMFSRIEIFNPEKYFNCVQRKSLADGYAFAFCELQNGFIAVGLNAFSITDLNNFSHSAPVLSKVSVQIHDLAHYSFIKRLTLDTKNGNIEGLCVTSEGMLISTQSNGTLKIWDPKQDYKCIRTVPWLSNSKERYSIFELYKISENILGYCGSDHIDLRLVNTDFTESAQILKTHSESLFTMCKLTNGFLLGGFGDGSIKVWKPKIKRISSGVKPFIRTYNVDVLISHFKNIETLDDLTVGSRYADISIQELELLLEQFLDELIYLYNNSALEALLENVENTEVLPIPQQYAKAAYEYIHGNSEPLNQLLVQGKHPDKPTLVFTDNAVFLILPTQYNLSAPYFKNDLVINHEKAKIILWSSQGISKPIVNSEFDFESFITDGKRNFKLVYDIIMTIRKEWVVSNISLHDLKALCDSFYEHKVNSFFKRCQAITGVPLKVSMDKKYIHLEDHLERYAVVIPDPHLIEQVYQFLSPQYQEVIQAIVTDVCKIANDKGLFPRNIRTTLDHFKAFLQVALYQDIQLQQVLKEAYQQQWLEKPFRRLNLINLTLPLVFSFEEGNDWNGLIQTISDFKCDNYDQYRRIMSFLTRKYKKG